MKTLERKDVKYTADNDVALSDHEVLERIEVPDDLSGLTEIPSIGEPGGPAVTEPRRSATTVRWLRWLSVVALAVAGVLIAAMAMFGDSSSVTAPQVDAPWNWEVDGPGSNSLNNPRLAQTEAPWATANDGPGGYSSNLVPDAAAMAVTAPVVEFAWATHGPGSNSVAAMATPGAVWSWATHGPGSYSLDAAWLMETQSVETEVPWATVNDGPGAWLMETEVPWATVNDGPGGHSLNVIDT